MKPIDSIKTLPSLLRRRLTRAEFLRSLGRYALLGIFATVAAWLILRRRDAGASSAADACGYDLPCRQCAELPGCGLTRAAETRHAIRSARS